MARKKSDAKAGKRPASEEAFVEVLKDEIAQVAKMRVHEVVDRKRVRTWLSDPPVDLLTPKLVDVVVQIVSDKISKSLKKRDASLLDLLDKKTAAHLQAILDEDIVVSDGFEDFISDIMEQDFIEGLFTDIIYTSIVSFYQKVNPLFGRFTFGAAEDQIKGFIRLFMPMVQQQATAFATSRENQAVLMDFTREIARRVLAEPLAGFAALVSEEQHKKASAFAAELAEDKKLRALVTEIALAVWDDLYEEIGDRKVGELLDLRKNGDLLAARGAEALTLLLARPRLRAAIARHLATEE